MTDQHEQVGNDLEPDVLNTVVRNAVDALIDLCFVPKITNKRIQGYPASDLARKVAGLTGLDDLFDGAKHWTQSLTVCLEFKGCRGDGFYSDPRMCLEFTSVGKALLEVGSIDGIPLTTFAKFRAALGAQCLPKYRAIAGALHQCGKPSPLFEWLAMTPRDLSLQLAG